MCGITGYYCKKTSHNKSILSRMMNKMVHRGPDDEGSYIDKEHHIALGHRRLSIIDIEGGKQPFISLDKNYILTYNGEIYNYIELRQLLISKGYIFKTYSDTEVLLNMYIEFGSEMLNMLNGIFAFAVYNKIDKTLFLARDHFGVKPLYYFNKNNFFAFSSEIKSLKMHPEISFLKNQNKINEYIVLQMTMGKETLYDSIRKLEPASYIILKEGEIIKNENYWDLNYQMNKDKTEEEFASELMLLIQNSTSLQLRADVPVGTYLSGGTDSSIISVLAAQNYPSRIKTFSGAFKLSKKLLSQGYLASDYDETYYAKIISQKIKSEHYEIFPTYKDFISNFEKLTYLMDEPSAGPGLFSQYMVSKLASEKVKVVLGGHGGDELFGGYARYGIAYLEECIKGAIYDTQKNNEYIVTLDSMIKNLPMLKQYVPLLKRQFSSGLFDSMDKRYFRLINRSHKLSELYNKDFLSSIDMNKIFDQFRSIFNKPGSTSYFNKMSYFDTKVLLPSLLQVEDRVSMGVSIESRVPLLDKKVGELAASIPPNMKFAKGKLKYMLLKSADKILPKEITKRKDKMGFTTPLNEWFKGPLKEYIMDILLSNESRQRNMYRVDKIESQLKIDGRFNRDLWGLLNIELWQRNN